MQDIPHHLKSLIFQAFHKKTSSIRKRSFNFLKCNKINDLQNQDAPKNTPASHIIQNCDANCDAFFDDAHHSSLPLHLWLRKNILSIYPTK